MKIPKLGGKGDKRTVVIGVYVILLLALVRLLIYPLHAAVKDRRTILDEQRERNGIKIRMLERVRQSPQEDRSRDADRMRAALYPRGDSISGIQAGILMKISDVTEHNGMSVTGFEMPEAVTVGKITEIPVIFRLKGRPESLVPVLKIIGEQKKALIIKAMDVSAGGRELTVSLIMQALRSEI